MKTVQPIRDKEKIEHMKAALKNLDYKYYILFVIGINTGLRISDLLELQVNDIKDKSHIRIWEQKTGKEKRFFINENLRTVLDPFMAMLSDHDYLFKSQKRNNQAMTIKQYQHLVASAAVLQKKEGSIQGMPAILKKLKHGQAAALLYDLCEQSDLSADKIINMSAEEVLQEVPGESKQLIHEFEMKHQVNGKLFKLRQGEFRPIGRVQAYKVLNAAAKKIGLDQVGTHTLRKTFGYWHYQQYKDVAVLQYIFNHSSPSVTLIYIGIDQDNMDSTIMQFSL